MPKRTKTEQLAEAGLLPAFSPSGTRCIANNKNGGKCKRWAIRGASVCSAHGGSAPQVREAAVRRLEGAIDRLLSALLHIVEDETQPAAARVAAIRDALDRADFGKGKEVTVKLARFEEDFAGLFIDTDDIVDAEIVEDRGQLSATDRALLNQHPANRD